MRLLDAGLRFLSRSRRPCLWAVLGDALHDLPPGEAWDVWHDFQRRVLRDMGRARLPLWWVAVFETTTGPHFNMIFLAPPGFDERMRGWTPFQPYLRGEGAVQWVNEAEGGFRGLTSYLAKERTSQSEWVHGRDLGPRLKGSHRIGDPVIDEADSVWVSPKMKAALIREGAIPPDFARTTRKNRVSVAALPVAAQPAAPVPVPALEPAAVAPTIEAQPIAAVVETPTVRTVAIETAAIPSMTNAPAYQLALALDQPAQPRAPDDEWVHHERAARGLTQAEFGALGGIRQPHVANVERAHDRLRYRTRREIAYRLALLDQGRMAA